MVIDPMLINREMDNFAWIWMWSFKSRITRYPVFIVKTIAVIIWETSMILFISFILTTKTLTTSTSFMKVYHISTILSMIVFIICSLVATPEVFIWIVPSTLTSIIVMLYPSIIILVSSSIVVMLSHLTRSETSVLKTTFVIEANILGKLIPHILIEHVSLIALLILTDTNIMIACTLYTL